VTPDFLDMLHALSDAGVEYLLVGAHARAVHGSPRATGEWRSACVCEHNCHACNRKLLKGGQ
jgi:hypothetical protein